MIYRIALAIHVEPELLLNADIVLKDNELVVESDSLTLQEIKWRCLHYGQEKAHHLVEMHNTFFDCLNKLYSGKKHDDLLLNRYLDMMFPEDDHSNIVKEANRKRKQEYLNKQKKGNHVRSKP